MFRNFDLTKIHHKNCIMVRGGVGAISTYLGGVNLFGLTIMIWMGVIFFRQTFSSSVRGLV